MATQEVKLRIPFHQYIWNKYAYPPVEVKILKTAVTSNAGTFTIDRVYERDISNDVPIFFRWMLGFSVITAHDTTHINLGQESYRSNIKLTAGSCDAEEVMTVSNQTGSLGLTINSGYIEALNTFAANLYTSNKIRVIDADISTPNTATVAETEELIRGLDG